MKQIAADPTAGAREAESLRAVMAAAQERQRSALEKSAVPPRFLLESARSMAEHTGMSQQRMADCVAPMALWQLYLPAALGTTEWDFAAVREHFACSYERIRAALAVLEPRPQVVSTLFHMAAFPLLCVLVGAAWRELYQGPLHLLVAGRNMAWFHSANSRWVNGAIDVISTDAAGLRRLMAGLKTGTIRRLLILADGPQAPGPAGTRALTRVSPALGIKTTLLTKIHGLGIPLVPITHEWEAGRLVVTPRPPIFPQELDETAMIDAVVGDIEGLLSRHPEQWLNWSAARIRT